MQKENNGVNINDSKTLAEKIVSVLLEKDGLDVRMNYVKDTSSVTDYYINVTGRSSTNVMALADEVVVIADGKISRHGSKEEVLPDLMKEFSPSCCAKR